MAIIYDIPTAEEARKLSDGSKFLRLKKQIISATEIGERSICVGNLSQRELDLLKACGYCIEDFKSSKQYSSLLKDIFDYVISW